MKKVNLTCIIDDDPIFVFGIKKVMELINFSDSIMVFKNGQEALDNLRPIILAKKSLPDVILLDLNMPVLDGWQFLDEFIKIPCPKKIIIYIVSSSIDPEDVLKAKSYREVSDYIVKPITIERLKAVLYNFEKDKVKF